MKSIKISTSLYAGFTALIVMVLFVSLFGLYQVRNANQALESEYLSSIAALIRPVCAATESVGLEKWRNY